MMQFVSSTFSSDRASKRTQAFAERFKYGVISSTLLSPAFPSTPVPHLHRRSFSPSIPGKLGGHSRSTSLAESSIATETLSLTIPAEPETPLWPATLSFSFSIAALSAGFYPLSFLSLAGTLYYMHVHRLDLQTKPDVMTPVCVSWHAAVIPTYSRTLVVGSLAKFDLRWSSMGFSI